MNQLRLRVLDVIIIVLVLCAAAALFLCGFLPRERGETVLVESKYDGTVAEYPLAAEAEFKVTGGGYTLSVSINGGAVCVTSSGCPGHDCVKQGRISSAGECIICAPAGIAVRIIGQNTGAGTDGIAG